MNSMNEGKFLGQFVDKVANGVANALIFSAEQGTKRSPFPMISECEFPLDLLMEDTD